MSIKAWDEIIHPFPNFNDAIVEVWEWIDNFIPAWGGIIYPFPNFKDATVEVWEWINNFIPQLSMCAISCPYWD